jgi:hypothetical protein
MYAVKKGFEGAVVCVSDSELIKQGLSNRINLDIASQKQLKYLFDKGYVGVEKLEAKTKGVK